MADGNGRWQVWVSIVASVVLALLTGALGGVFWTANSALMSATKVEGRVDVIERLLLRR